MQSCDPVNDWRDPVPAIETRREFFKRLKLEGMNQNRIAAHEYAVRAFRAKYGRRPKPSEQS